MTADDIADRFDVPERERIDDESDGTELRSRESLPEDVRRLERRVADLEATVEELEAAVQAVRGYAGNVRAVNREVERRASAALAKAEALESSMELETTGTRQATAAHGGAPSRGPNEGVSSEPTLIAESGDEGAGDEHAVKGGSGQRTAGPDPDTGASGVRSGEHTDVGQQVDGGDDQDDTEQFIRRVRDAI